MKFITSFLIAAALSGGSFVAAAPAPVSSSTPGNVGANTYQTPSADFRNATTLDTAAFNSTVNGQKSLPALIDTYKQYMRDTLSSRGPEHSCNAATVMINKEWNLMSKRDRKAYTKAVQCLWDSPSQSDPNVFPGARNRYDDFVAVHINQVAANHFNGHLYAWHRHYTWLYDQALRNECGYKGPMPYWNWASYHEDPRQNPMFNGDEYSMSGNGQYWAHGITYTNALGKEIDIEPGTGGGCVTDGPFANWEVHMGVAQNTTYNATGTNLPPGALNQTSPYSASPCPDSAHGKVTWAPPPTSVNTTARDNAITHALEYNPRCLLRDLNLGWSNIMTDETVTNLLNCENARCLERRADGWDENSSNATNQANQLHNAGHLTIGGLNLDGMASAGDPMFFLHHGMLDRMWSIWEYQDPDTRMYQVGGTETPWNMPPGADVQIDDILYYDVLGDPVTIRDISSTIDGQYCYMYA